MSFQSQKLFGLAAVAVGIAGILGMGVYEVATSCDAKSETKSASYTSAEKSTSSSCAYGTKSATYAKASSSKKNASACGSKAEHSSFAAFAAATNELSNCEGKTSAALASVDDAGCEEGAKASFALASTDEAGCTYSKGASAALASSDETGCTHSKNATAALASSDGAAVALASSDGASCSRSKSASVSLVSSDGSSCSSSKSVSYASAKDDACSAASASACSDYNACSVKADLATAKGKTLEFYKKEAEMDGKEISDFRLPKFTATDIEGNKVNSADLIGQPTVLVLLASHCGHSYKSLPILEQAAAEFEAKGLRVVGLMVNSDAKSTKAWFDSEEINHEVWFTDDVSVADALKSHLVPTYVLVDADGYIKAKLVGFKKGEEVNKSIPLLLVQVESDQDNQEG